MKRLTIAVVVAIMVLAGVNVASSEMVDIGLGEMEKSEFLSLKAMVQKRPVNNGAALSTPLPRIEQYGMLEMSRTDFAALRDRMTGVEKNGPATPPVSPLVRIVTIGTGEMPRDEFLALKRMVEESHIFGLFDRMAAFQR